MKTVGFIYFFFNTNNDQKCLIVVLHLQNSFFGLFSSGQEQQAHPHHDLEPPRPLDRRGRGLHRLHPSDSVCGRSGSAEIQPVGGDPCVAPQRQQVAEHPLPLLRRTSGAAAVRYPLPVFRLSLTYFTFFFSFPKLYIYEFALVNSFFSFQGRRSKLCLSGTFCSWDEDDWGGKRTSSVSLWASSPFNSKPSLTGHHSPQHASFLLTTTAPCLSRAVLHAVSVSSSLHHAGHLTGVWVCSALFPWSFPHCLLSCEYTLV